MPIHRPSKLLTAALILVACVACDRETKHAAESLRGEGAVRLAGGIVTLAYAENRGAMLSIGAGLPEQTRFFVFTAGVGVLLACIAGVLLFSRSLPGTRAAALSLILAGGGSNLFDRVTRDGKVVDFVMLGIGGLRTGIFNVADVAIMSGAFLILFSVIPGRSPHNA